MRKKDWGVFKNQCKICGLEGHNIRGCPAVLPLATRAERKLEAGTRRRGRVQSHHGWSFSWRKGNRKKRFFGSAGSEMPDSEDSEGTGNL